MSMDFMLLRSIGGGASTGLGRPIIAWCYGVGWRCIKGSPVITPTYMRRLVEMEAATPEIKAEAMADSRQEVPRITLGSPERFGYEWDLYSEIRPEYEEQFRRWTVHLKTVDWKGRTFLDVGCGMGRNSYWPMIYGAAGGVAIDVDKRSLDAARQTLLRYPSVSVEERSAYDPGYE